MPITSQLLPSCAYRTLVRRPKRGAQALFCGVLLTLLAVSTHLAQAAPVMLGVDSAAVPSGADFTIDVSIGKVTDLYGFQFDLAFDPLILRADSAMEGGFLSGTGQSK